LGYAAPLAHRVAVQHHGGQAGPDRSRSRSYGRQTHRGETIMANSLFVRDLAVEQAELSVRGAT